MIGANPVTKGNPVPNRWLASAGRHRLLVRPDTPAKPSCNGSCARPRPVVNYAAAPPGMAGRLAEEVSVEFQS
jgi:hypothetical protein